MKVNIYFAGRLIIADNATVHLDRLGSVRNTSRYYPFGEEQGSGTIPQKFATYYRDTSTSLDNAMNRYYGSTMGRFTTPDPYGSASPTNPQSWNRYVYVANDPGNQVDPNGLLTLIIGGTGAGDPAWGQPGTPFFQAVESFFGETPQVWKWRGDSWPFLDRITIPYAGYELLNYISHYPFKPGEELNIVAHSHGGNVVKWYTRQIGARMIDTLITLGTPQRADFSIRSDKVKYYFNVCRDSLIMSYE